MGTGELDQTQRCSNSNGIGNNINTGIRSSNKKQKRAQKIPQRGLGVAQLEKIRLQDHAILPIIPSFHSSNQPCSSSSSSSCVAADLSPQNSMFGTQSSVQNIDSNIVSTTSANTVPILTSSCDDSPIWYKYWSSCEYNIEKECCGLDPGLVAFKTNLSLPYESDQPIWPLSSLMQRAQQSQQPSSSSMVNLSSRTSSTSVLDFQMEPPSNQSYNYGNCTLLSPDIEEDKAVGMKRSYPFSLDNAPGPPIHTKYPTINIGQLEAASSGNVSTFNFEPGTPSFREGPFSTPNLEPKSKKSIKENGVFDGDFLTLAPPTTHSSSSTKFKHPSSSLTYYNCELPDLDSLAYGASLEDSIIKQRDSGLNQYYRPYYSFFPPAMVQIDRAATTLTKANCKGGEVGHVDLNLKL